MTPHSTLTPLTGMTREELETLAVELGEPPFRGRQLAEWLYRRGVDSFAAMTNLSRRLRESLTRRFAPSTATVVAQQDSRDGARKLLLEFPDGCRVETVLLPYPDRTAVCVSSQVGCRVGCPFCATGRSGFERNLTAGEIVEQVLAARRALAARNVSGQGDGRVTHVVFMGMGEPLLNYEAVVKAVRLLTDEVGLGGRRLTVSTVGITPAIDRLAAEQLSATLAVSLQAPDDTLRRELVPMASRYPLADLLAACRRYLARTRRRVTFEYVLLKGINDSPDQARTTARLVRPLRAAVNLIPYNPVPGVPFERPAPAAVAAFRRLLETAGVTVTQRVERGLDIAGACGQLRRRVGREETEARASRETT